MRNIPFKSTCVLIILVVFFCSQEKSTYTIETKDGVKYVHNHVPLWGDTLKVALEFVRQIGVLEGDDENYMFYSPSDFLIDNEGNVYILDAGNYRIQKFDNKLNFIASYGRRGQGPSEFMNPLSMELDAVNNMYIGESRSSRIIVLNQEGKEIKRFNLEHMFKPSDFIITRSNRLINEAILSVRMGPFDKDMEELGGLIQIFDLEGRLLKEFVQLKKYRDPYFMIFSNIIWFTVDVDENIFVTFLGQNRIEKYSPDGELLMSIDRELPFEESGSLNIACDSKERLWVWTNMTPMRKEKQETKIEVYNADGVLLTRIPTENLKKGKPKIYGDRLYILDQHEDMCVYEYKIIEK